MESPECIIGIGAFGHDASACVVDASTGRPLFAVAEERLDNVKHSWRFPIGATQRCRDWIKRIGGRLAKVGVNFTPEPFAAVTLRREMEAALPSDAAKALWKAIEALLPFGDYFERDVGFSRKTIDRALKEGGLADAPESELRRRIQWYYNWSIKYRRILQVVERLFPGVEVEAVDHHRCHAFSAWMNSGFEEAAVLTIDGQGEAATTGIYRADGEGLNLLAASNWPHSLGIFYLNATVHLGFSLGDEYKVMGMAAYGKPVFAEALEEIVRIDDGGVLELRETANYGRCEVGGLAGHFSMDFTDVFREKLAPRRKDEEIEQKHFDFAASVQAVTERAGVELARAAVRLAGSTRLAIAGGVGLNGLMNERIRRESGCSEIFIFPAAADDGASIGAAQALAWEMNHQVGPRMNDAFLGHEPSDTSIREVLEKMGVKFERPDSIHDRIAEAIAEKEIVARYVGRSEYGPRALGDRSIMANPTAGEMKETLNERIKHREPFRPFAPACLAEHVQDYFDIDCEAPFMLLIAQAKDRARKELPAVVHEDGTARVQTVSEDGNPEFWRTLTAFRERTGTPVLINTSFNVNGETIVDTPLDAIESFGHMDIDHLAIGDYWVSKAENRKVFEELPDAEYLKKRQARYAAEVTHPLAEFDLHEFPFNRPDPKEKKSPSMAGRVCGFLKRRGILPF